MDYIFTGEIRVKNPRADNAEKNILHFLHFISCDDTESMNRYFPVREYIPGSRVMKITYDHVKLSSAMFSTIKYLCELTSNLYTVNGGLRYTAEDLSFEGKVSIRDNRISDTTLNSTANR